MLCEFSIATENLPSAINCLNPVLGISNYRELDYCFVNVVFADSCKHECEQSIKPLITHVDGTGMSFLVDPDSNTVMQIAWDNIKSVEMAAT